MDSIRYFIILLISLVFSLILKIIIKIFCDGDDDGVLNDEEVKIMKVEGSYFIFSNSIFYYQNMVLSQLLML